MWLIWIFGKAGLSRETYKDLLGRVCGHDGHAVPLVEPVARDVQTRFLEGLAWKLIVFYLSFLQAQNVDIVLGDKVQRPLCAGTNGVNIPRGDAHATYSTCPLQRGQWAVP